MGERLCGFKSRPRHQPGSARHWGDVAKWTKAEVCKTSIRRFESARRLQPMALKVLTTESIFGLILSTNVTPHLRVTITNDTRSIPAGMAER